MRLRRELERLLQRVQQISIEQAPPTLRMVMVKDDIIPPRCLNSAEPKNEEATTLIVFL